MADNYRIDLTLDEIFGTGISSMEQTTVSTEPGGENVWTATLTNGVSYNFSVYNGSGGGSGGGGTIPDGSITEEKLSADLQLKTLNEYVTPQMYGAKGDSVTDDTSAFISMLASGNKYFYIPSGTYVFNSSINIQNFSKKTIIGEPYGKTVFNFTGSGYLFNIFGGSDSEISNITIRGNGTNGGVSIADNTPSATTCRCNRLRLREVVFTNCNVGINIDAPTGYIYIDKCSVNTIPIGGYGIKIGSGYTNTVTVEPGFIYIQNTNIDDGVNRQGVAGIDISHAVHVYIIANDICNFKNGYAIDIHSDVKHIYSIQILSNSIFGNLHGIRVRAMNYFCRLISVIGNHIRIETNGYGEEYYGSSSRRIFGVVSNNSMYYDQSAITDYLVADKVQDFTHSNWQAYTDTNVPKSDYFSYGDITGHSKYLEDNAFIVTVSGSPTLTADVTFAEANAAHSAGLPVYIQHNEKLLEVQRFWPSVMRADWVDAKGGSYSYIEFASDESVTMVSTALVADSDIKSTITASDTDPVNSVAVIAYINSLDASSTAY